MKTAQTETENQSQLILDDARPLWAICPGCKKERRVRESGEMCNHRRYVPEFRIMEYCDGSYGKPGKVTVWSQKRKDSGKARGKYNVRAS